MLVHQYCLSFLEAFQFHSWPSSLCSAIQNPLSFLACSTSNKIYRNRLFLGRFETILVIVGVYHLTPAVNSPVQLHTFNTENF